MEEYTDFQDYLEQHIELPNRNMFISNREASRAKAEADAIYTDHQTNDQIYSNVYHTAMRNLNVNTNHTYYYLTFKPFNESYEKFFDWYQNRMVDNIFKRYKKNSTYLFITKETQAAKIHCNLLIETKNDLLKELDKNIFNKVKIHVQKVKHGYHNRRAIVNYMTKEAKERPFEYYKDFVYKYTPPV